MNWEKSVLFVLVPVTAARKVWRHGRSLIPAATRHLIRRTFARFFTDRMAAARDL